jgi:hypothetical protein
MRLFRDWLDGGGKGGSPCHLLTDADASEPVTGVGEVDAWEFESRYDAGRRLEPLLRGYRGRIPLPEHKGMWSWLSLYYVEQLRSPSARAHGMMAPEYYIPSDESRTYYRHILRTAVLMVMRYGDLARYVLASNLRGLYHSHFTDDLTYNRNILSNPRLIEVAGLLYFNERIGLLRRRTTTGRGNSRRLIKVLQQLELNYDLYGDLFTVERILSLLPSEFDGWKRRMKAREAKAAGRRSRKGDGAVDGRGDPGAGTTGKTEDDGSRA